MLSPAVTRFTAVVVATCIVGCVTAPLSAQGPPPAAPPAAAPPPAAPTLLATDGYLFVVRGDVLFQFDLHTLALRHSFRFPPPGAAADLASAARPATPRTATAPAPAVAPVAEVPGRRSAAELQGGAQLALQWLVQHQDDDGKWDCDRFMKHDSAERGVFCDGAGNPVHDVGVTGLALLALLGDGSTMRSGPYRDAIKQAVNWLRSQQQDNGLFGSNASHDFIYDHAIATYAICEAYGLSSYRLLQPIAQRGLDYLESHRNPYSVWRYQPRDNDNDTSVTTWAALALTSGAYFGLQVNKSALDLIGVWYDQVTDASGRAGYTKAGEPSSRLPGDHAARFPPTHGEAMTAAAALGRVMLGQQPATRPMLGKAAVLLASKPPRWEPGHVDAVYWYFGTVALGQLGGAPWDAWSAASGTLLDNQRLDGNHAGSWDAVGVWDAAGGRVGATALHAMALQVLSRQPSRRRQ